MTTTFRLAPHSWPRWLWISTLLIGAALLSPAYHCGFPLVAFVTIAALTSGRQDALFASVAVLLTHETLIFASQHHHATNSALTWAAAFGVIALMSLRNRELRLAPLERIHRRHRSLRGGLCRL